MKRAKRMVAIVITLMIAMSMMAAMSLVSFAAGEDYSITVNKAKAGETYSAYKMLDLSVDDPANPTAYRYTVNSEWNGFADTEEFKAVYKVDAQGYVTSAVESEGDWSATSDLSILAEKAAAYASAHKIKAAGSVKIGDDENSGKINLTEAGYYIISSTLGSRAMIETTPANPGVTINEKNSEDTIEKEVQEDSTNFWGEKNDAQIGDLVKFKSTVKVAPRSINVVVHDTMTKGLSFSGNTSIDLWTDEGCSEALSSDLYEIKATPDEGDTFTVVIKDEFAASTTADANIYITYTAVLNKDAIVNAGLANQTNTTSVSFGDGTSSNADTTTTETHKFEVLKYRAGNDAKANLADAVFELKKGDEVVKLIKLDERNYRVADAAEKTGEASSHANEGELNTVEAGALVSDFVTVSSGNIVIWGVDSDKDYKLHEVQPPKGYNQLAEDAAVDVEAANTTVVEVPNATGAELPSTGGIGTVIFYVVGCGLLIGCGIVLISRKRMMNK